MSNLKSFIYIASLRRTGSTVLSEALTHIPFSFIFREPKLGKKKFSIKANDFKIFKQLNVDLAAFKERCLKLKDRNFIKEFKKDIYQQLKNVVEQIGVKEIRHEGWQDYLHYFPDMKVILTGRDPRDIYISLHNRIKNKKGNWIGEFSPTSVAEDLNRQFQFQLEMYKNTDCYKITYETLCRYPKKIEEIKAFVGSSIPKIGCIGGFNSTNPNRVDEFILHGRGITDKRVNRWENEVNSKLREEALECSLRMKEYKEFWEYKF